MVVAVVVGVSILVLVDAALRQIRLINADVIDGCFNPCFSGCRPATFSHASDVRVVVRVSILVLVDAALRLVHLCE